MKLHTVFITYNRLELTMRAFESYLETVTLPNDVWIADNASTDGTQEWIHEMYVAGHIDGMVLFKNNMYPGHACNVGWEHLDDAVTHLHRADNDFIFLEGWCEEVERMFSVTPNLGQLGLRTDEEELNARLNVGGNCVITRVLWDGGLRWDERPWPQIRDEVGPGWTEDSIMSKSIKKTRMPVFEQGHYTWDRVERRCIQSISFESPEDSYYRATWADRGITLDG